MDQTTKEFLDYLCYIGLVSSDSVNNFLNCLYSNVNSSDKLKEILSNTFYFYIKSLNENILKKITSIVVNNFFVNKLKVNIRLINPIFKIYQKFNFKRVKQSFFLWFKKTFSYNTNKEYYHNYWKKLENNNLDEYNEDETINNNFYSDKKRFNKKLIRNSYLSSFQNSRTLRSRSNNSSRSIIQDFINRQDEYNKKKKKNKEYLFKQNEEEYNFLYTFSPKLEERTLENNSKKNSNNDTDNIYLKLYEHFNKKQNNRNQKEFTNKNIDNSNNTTKRIRNYSYFTTTNENNISNNKNSNKKKFDKLYNEYKQRNSRIDELTKRIYQENCITFKPNITKKPVYKKKKKI